jgi:hypothetical protein
MFRINNRIAASALALLGLLALASPSQANILPGPNTTVNLAGTSLQQDITLRYVTVASRTVEFRTKFNVAGQVKIWSGVLRQMVVKEAISGKLTFYYQLASSSVSQYPDFGVLVFAGNAQANYRAGALNIDWRSDMGAGTAPDQVQNVSSYILFKFTQGGLQPGQTSRWFYIRTNAVGFALNDQVQLYNTSDAFNIYGPTP